MLKGEVRFRAWDGDTGKRAPTRLSPFRAPYTKTLDLLRYELGELDASNVIIEIDTDQTQIRNDGFPRSSAKVNSPAVRISFESKAGPLCYTAASFNNYEDNIRAIAIALEDLRRITRYGIGSGTEQYRGWRRLEAGSGTPSREFRSVDEAIRFIAGVAVLPAGTELRRLYLEAMKACHPDTGCDPAEADQVNQAKAYIEAVGEWPRS